MPEEREDKGEVERLDATFFQSERMEDLSAMVLAAIFVLLVLLAL